MKHNGKYLAQARTILEQRRQTNLEEHQKRVDMVNKAIPEMPRIDETLSMQMIQATKMLLSGKPDAAEKLKRENLSLQMKKAELLVRHGFPQNYLEEIYTCPVCRDTGMDGQNICSCLEKLYSETLTKQLSGLLKTGKESFSAFDPSLYPEENRAYMTKIRDLCMEYARYFPEVDNLLLSGAPGLGKTFLSACIAREILSQHVCSIVYDTASSIFSCFDRKPFTKDAEQENASSKASSILNCDLLILDDLGTEYTTASVMSALYTIVNTRTSEGKNTIINTNLSMQELKKRYSGAICSRLDGYFTNLTFEGEDIRQKF